MTSCKLPMWVFLPNDVIHSCLSTYWSTSVLWRHADWPIRAFHGKYHSLMPYFTLSQCLPILISILTCLILKGKTDAKFFSLKSMQTNELNHQDKNILKRLDLWTLGSPPPQLLVHPRWQHNTSLTFCKTDSVNFSLFIILMATLFPDTHCTPSFTRPATQERRVSNTTH